MTLHPWAEVVRKDVSSFGWNEEPNIAVVRGPRKSKFLTICDRMAEKVGSVYDWTICNDGRADSEEERGKCKNNA